jgi:hypothetical protein
MPLVSQPVDAAENEPTARGAPAMVRISFRRAIKNGKVCATAYSDRHIKCFAARRKSRCEGGETMMVVNSLLSNNQNIRSHRRSRIRNTIFVCVCGANVVIPTKFPTPGSLLALQPPPRNSQPTAPKLCVRCARSRAAHVARAAGEAFAPAHCASMSVLTVHGEGSDRRACAARARRANRPWAASPRGARPASPIPHKREWHAARRARPLLHR